MALLQVSEAPSRSAYEAVTAALGGDRPAGRLLHAAAERPDGTVQIVDVFDSQESLDAFGEVIMGAFARTGLLAQMDPSQRPTPYEAFHLDRA